MVNTEQIITFVIIIISVIAISINFRAISAGVEVLLPHRDDSFHGAGVPLRFWVLCPLIY